MARVLLRHRDMGLDWWRSSAQGRVRSRYACGRALRTAAHDGYALEGRGRSGILPLVIALAVYGCVPPGGGTELVRDSQALGDGHLEELINDATGRLDYGRCEDVDGFDREAHEEIHGLLSGEADQAFRQAVKLTAFRKVAALKASLQFVRVADSYEDIELPLDYYALPDFSAYYDEIDRINRALGVQRDLLRRSHASSDQDEDVIAHLDGLRGELSDLESERAAIESQWAIFDSGAREARLRDVEQRMLSVLTLIAGIDPDRSERRRIYQNQLKAAAFEIALVAAVDRWSTPRAIRDVRVWDNALDPFEMLTASERLEQLYAQFPILAVDDSWLFLHNDLAERVVPLLGLALSPRSLAEVLERDAYVRGRDERGRYPEGETLRAAYRERIQELIHPVIVQLAESDHDPAVAREIDWALDRWLETIDGELASLPMREGEDLMAYTDLVDGALSMAPPSLLPLWLDSYCRSETHRQLADLGKQVLYIAIGAGALVAALLGQMWIAIPLGIIATTAFVADSIQSAIRAAELRDTQMLFWVSHGDYTDAEREALISAVFAAASVAGEVAGALRIVRGLRAFNAVRSRLAVIAAEHGSVSRGVDTLRAEIAFIEASGNDAQHLYAALDRALRAKQSAEVTSAVAERTLDAMQAAESSMGRIDVAHLMAQFGNDETKIVAFFEVVSRDQGRWSPLAQQGYRAWLRAIKNLGSEDAAQLLPAACR